MSDFKQEQIKLAEELQMGLLRNFKRLMDDDALTAADRKTLADLLSKNGWSLDPFQLPQSIKDKLTDAVDPTDISREHPHLRVSR